MFHQRSIAFLAAALLIMVASCKKDVEDQVVVDAGTDAAVPDVGPDATADASPDTPGADTDASEPFDGITIEGLSGAVDVTFDEWGVLHVECEVDEDCFAVQGYFHAAHRFAQMDITRRNVRGKLSAAVGDLALDTDKATRLFFTTRDGQ
ncbi:MAG: penicillin acylase family protein, partial [Bradymonadaceae bacterium]